MKPQVGLASSQRIKSKTFSQACGNSPLERKNRVFGIELAVSIIDGPELSEKRRKELALALLMAETIGVILYTGESDSDIRTEAAKDMVRKFRVVYPEIAEI
jgi:hypothetical protein